MARTEAAPVGSVLLVLVGVVMGSDSDWSTMRFATAVLEEFQVPFEAKVVSAHRTPDLLFEYAESARDRGLKAIIASASGAAHLPGMLASKTTVPVLGVPGTATGLAGLDSLLSIVQMPRGVPVATFTIGEWGAVNAALFAVAILSTSDQNLAGRLDEYRRGQAERVLAMKLPPD